MARPKLPKTFKLFKPINDGTREIAELTITAPPSTGDFMGMTFANPGTKDFALVMSKIFHLPLPIINQMDMADFMEIGGVISDFLERD